MLILYKHSHFPYSNKINPPFDQYYLLIKTKLARINDEYNLRYEKILGISFLPFLIQDSP